MIRHLLTAAHRSSLAGDRRGEVAIEYGLLVAMLAIALIGMSSMTGVAEKQSDTFDKLSETMNP